MQYGLKVNTGPSVEPVSLDEAKDHLRVDHSEEDSLISSLITAARKNAEVYMQRALITQEMTLTMDQFPEGHVLLPELFVYTYMSSVIYLPRSPVQSVDELRYIDTEGNEQTEQFRADTVTEPARVTAEYGEIWPPTRPITNAVEVDFTAGYGDAAEDVPEGIKAAIKLMVSNYYEHRTPVVIGSAQTMPMSVEALLGPYRVGTQAGSL